MNIQSITLPLEEQQLWDIIENGQKEKLNVDVVNSFANLQDKLLYYISNVELDVQFDWTGCDFETKSAIVLSYINLNRLYYNQDLVMTLFDLVMCYKGIFTEQLGIFTHDQTVDFINNHLDLFEKLIGFLDSVILLVCNGFAPIHDMFDPELFEKVEDSSISLNSSYLFKMPEFAAYYSMIDHNNLKWYDIQFTKPIYDNHFLHDIVFETTSGLATATYAVLKEQHMLEE